MEADDSKRLQLLESGRKLEQTRMHILEANRTALETEQTGFAVLTDLARQREQIQRTSDQVAQVNSNITQSNRVMVQMSRRAMIKRMALAFMVVVLVLTLALVMYFLWIKR
uniref:Vesicle transport v-SNARE protein n=1 Tax=Pfiesteria piscicida TaxID=71001 RepID=A3E3D5_PFIPI|nr:vesicle transport v-SNARE protein [Pfiesteria piscicida]ABI14203.1 vesicle transport v-SNARE protein [Pfiesteria piscicida]